MEEPSRASRRPLTAPVLGVCLLLGLAIQAYRSRVLPTVGMDFYHLWGISAARVISDDRDGDDLLGSPYVYTDRYASMLNAHADRSLDRRLQAVNSQWRTLTPTGSPVLYASFFFLPVHYSTAIAWYRVLQLVFLGLGFGFLWRMLCRHEPLFFAGLGLVLFLGFEPILSDLRVGNTNTFHFFGFTLVLMMASRARRAAPGRPRGVLAAVCLATALLLGLAKPVWVPLVCVLAMHLWLTLGTLPFLVAAVPTMGVATAGALIPGALFGSWAVWAEWYQYVYGADHTRLLFPIVHGNYSTSLLLHETLDRPIWVMIAGVVAALAGSLALSIPRRGWKSAVRDPQIAMAVGIVATVATAPLFWLHYYMLLLIPALWLLFSASRLAAVSALIALVLCSGLVDPVWSLPGWGGRAVPWSRVASWMLLWCGILLHLRATKPWESDAGCSHSDAARAC